MVIKHIKNYLVIAILLFGCAAIAQTEVKNKIVDFLMQTPIESASIYLQNTTIGTVSNADGRFALVVPQEFVNDTLIISSIGYKSYKIPVDEFDNNFDVFLEEDVASLDEIILIAETRPKSGNEIVLKAIEKLAINLPDSTYIQKGFLRHKERNKVEFKWLIESAITVYDSGFAANSSDYLKINVDQVRKSYDLRDVDSIFNYVAYSNQIAKRSRLKVKDVRRSQLSTSQLEKAIKWNDTRVNGLQNIFHGKLNLLRNSSATKALFGKDVLEKHNFKLDTILVDNDRKIYKIKISESTQFVDLETKGIFNAGYEAKGWLYVYYDNYAIKKIEYELVAASPVQKVRSRRLFDTQVNHKLIMTYMEYQDKMYPNYIYYETPKLVNVGLKTDQKVSDEEKERYNREERFYYTVQEILFSEIILDKDVIKMKLDGEWDMDIFSSRPYDKAFWKNYNVLLESEEDEKMIQDLSQRASLFKD
jgi:hypothetical protein